MTALTMAHCNDSAAHDARQCLHGIAVSPGRASGHAYVLRTPEEAEGLPEGAILIVPSLAVGFAAAIAQAAGVVADHGGSLSNGGTLAREAGVPTVVLEGASSLLHPGDLMVIDGASGDITVCTPAKPGDGSPLHGAPEGPYPVPVRDSRSLGTEEHPATTAMMTSGEVVDK